MSERNCPSCGAPIDLNAAECKYCGEVITTGHQQHQVYKVHQAPQMAQAQPEYAPSGVQAPRKSKITAGILAILLGGIGAHKFYLRKPFQGILYLLLCWTWIPEILGVIEGIIYLISSDEKFHLKYDRIK